MKYQETGRFGRITKQLRKQGFEREMENILFDSHHFKNLNKSDQTKYVETIVSRMNTYIGADNTDKILYECGAQCCGKSWSKFAKGIWDQSDSIDDFFVNLNREEEKYNTHIDFDRNNASISVERSKCICGLINKGPHFQENIDYCKCSLGHMSVFFKSVFNVTGIKLVESIYSGADKCKWKIKIQI